MSKELEIIKKWKSQIHWNKDFGWEEELEIIEKSLKALEIIKEKRCDIYLLMECERLEHYNENDYLSSDQVLTPEEFDLLKEVLQ